MRRTKIICTLGPACDDENILEKMMENGMDCARFNFSHGTHDEHKERMDKVRRLCRKKGKHIPLLLDTKGPEIRVKDFENRCADLKKGEKFILTPENIKGTRRISGVSYPFLAKYITPGARILLDDGKIVLYAEEILGKEVVCRIAAGGRISDHKSINIPDIYIPMPYISSDDKSDLLFGIEEDVDYIAASFVRDADDMIQLRTFLNENGGSGIKIIAKIENRPGMKNLDEIIEASDGVMVARGDLGVEIPFKYLPAIQKDIIEKCYIAGKHVVTATQMLESMTENLRPTRAEVSDVANAIYDGTTAVMLSGESAAGNYPAEAVKAMADIAEAAESSINYALRFNSRKPVPGKDFTHAIGIAACNAAYYLGAKAIVAVTRSGKTAKLISNYRPECPIIAVTADSKGKRQLNLAWGVVPVTAAEQRSPDLLFDYGMEKALETGLLQKGDLVVLVAGSSLVKGEFSDMLKLDIADQDLF